MEPSSISESSDEVLWQMFIGGDDAAFEAIFKRNYPRLYQYGRKYSPDEEFVKDTIQDLFAELWLHRAGLGQTLSVRRYLFKSLRRKMLRSKAQMVETTLLTSEDDQFVFTLNPEQILINDEFSAELRKQMEHWLSFLPPRQREAIYLRFYQEMSYDEMTSVMDVENHTVRNLIYEALKLLRRRLTLILFSLIVSL